MQMLFMWMQMLFMWVQLCLLVVVGLGCAATTGRTTVTQDVHMIVPPAKLRNALYPEWAHHHWVWLSNDRANQSSMMDYATEYLNHGIQVGAVDIDSGWSTGFNNFVFDVKKYPNATQMIEYFHSKGIRVMLWATSMVDEDSPNFQEAYNKSYFIKDVLGRQSMISWWHGKGGLIDYSDPDALHWWHSQMDKAISLGIDGWKCDGTDPYILELVFAFGKKGLVTRKQYSDAYYGDFFDYTRQKLGEDRLIMSRPVDGFDFIFLDYSPRHVVLSGWVGDQDPTFQGLQDALKRYLQSAWQGYANFGSDIGGYRSGDGVLGRSKELLVRWAQLGAFSPLMENGGNKEHRPWKFDDNNQTLNIYKKFVDIHYQLVDYLLTVGSEAYEHNKSSILPLAKHESLIEKLIDDFKPDTYNYLLGPNILVAPIISNSSTVTIEFPAGNSWVYWFNHSAVHQGGTKAEFNNIPLEEFPVFFKNGTFLPLRVTQDTPLLGRAGFTGYQLWSVHSPTPSSTPLSSFIRREGGPGVQITHWWPSGNCLSINITAHPNLNSVVEVQGLKQRHELKEAKVLTASKQWVSIPRATSIDELKQNEPSYHIQKCNISQHYTLYVHLQLLVGCSVQFCFTVL